jgi:hypothetical protein
MVVSDHRNQGDPPDVVGVALSGPVRLNASPGGYREERYQIAIDFVAVPTPPVGDKEWSVNQPGG